MSALSFLLRFNLNIVVYLIMPHLLHRSVRFFLSGGLVVYWKKLEVLSDDFDFIFSVIHLSSCSVRNCVLHPLHLAATHLWSVELLSFPHRVLFMASCLPLTLSLPPPFHRNQLFPWLSSAPEYSSLPAGSGHPASSYDPVREFSVLHSSGASQRL